MVQSLFGKVPLRRYRCCLQQMAGLVVEEKVGLKFAQESALGQAAQKHRLINLDMPLHQGANSPFMCRYTAGGDQCGADLQDLQT
jgi:hypothetical protein